MPCSVLQTRIWTPAETRNLRYDRQLCKSHDSASADQIHEKLGRRWQDRWASYARQAADALAKRSDVLAQSTTWNHSSM